MKKNTSLKMMLFKRGITQRRLARLAEIPESHLSLYITGKLHLDKTQVEKIHSILNEVPQHDA
jgi:hypothetical protein